MFYDLLMTCMLKHIFLTCMLKPMFIWTEENKRAYVPVGGVYLFIQETFLHVENCTQFGSLKPVGCVNCFNL